MNDIENELDYDMYMNRNTPLVFDIIKSYDIDLDSYTNDVPQLKIDIFNKAIKKIIDVHNLTILEIFNIFSNYGIENYLRLYKYLDVDNLIDVKNELSIKYNINPNKNNCMDLL